jgi:PAS domain S-box-containing protein
MSSQRMKMRPTIAARLTLLFVLFAAGLMTVGGLTAYVEGRALLEKATSDRLTATALEKQAALDSWMEDCKSDLRMLAADPGMVQLVDGLFQEAGSDKLPTEHDSLVRYLNLLTGGEDVFRSILVLDAASGRAVAATDPDDEGGDFHAWPFFIGGREDTSVQNAFVSSSEPMAVLVSVPIHSASGQLLAVLAAETNLAMVNDIAIRHTGLYETQDAFLVNTSHVIVTQPRFPPAADILHQRIYSEAVNRCLAQTNGTASVDDYRKVPSLIAYRWMPEHELCLIVKVDLTEATAPIRAFGVVLLIIAALALAFGTLIAAALARSITRPIQQLVQGTEEFGRGHLDYRIQSNAQDEIGRLAKALDSMAANLQISLGETALGERRMSVLDQAAQAVLKTRTPGEVYRAIGEAVTGLGHQALVFELSEDRRSLILVHHTYRSALVAAGEKLVGLSSRGFQFPVHPGNIHHQVITQAQVRFFNDPAVPIGDALANVPRSLVKRLISLIGVEQVIYAPLIFDGIVTGLLQVMGQGLTDADIPAISVFANQAAIALENANYRQHMERLVDERAANLRQINEDLASEIAKHKQAEEALRQSESMLQQAQRVSRVGSWSWHIPSNQLEWSAEMYHIFGIDQKDFTGNLSDVIARAIHPDDRAAVEQANLSVARDKKPVAMEYRVLWPDGTVRIVWAEAGELVLDDTGQPILLTGMVQDITERKAAEEERQRREKTFQAFVETTKEWIWAIDLEGRHTYCNPALKNILGYSAEEFIGKESLSFLHEEDLTLVQTLLQEKRTAREGWSGLVIRWRHKDGSYRYLESTAVPILDDEGRLIGYQGADRDITERRQADEALRQSEEDFRQLFDAESDAILLIDNQTGRILRANNAASILYGYAHDDLLSLQNTDLSAEPEDTQKVTRGTPLQSENVIHIPLRWHRKKDGTRFPVEITGRFFSHQGRSVHIAAIRDITERKRAEEALRESRRMLETVLDSIPSAVFWKDRNFQYLGGNHTWLEAIGRKTADEVVGKSDYDLPWSKPEADSYREYDRRVMESGMPEYDIVEPYRKADGTRAWAKTNKVPLRDSEGNIIGILGTYEDITEWKHSEEVMREHEQRLASIYSTAGDVLFYLSVEPDEQYRFVSVNPAFSKVTGFPVEQVVGKTVHEVIPEPSLGMVLGKFRQAIAEKANVRWEETSEYPAGRLTGEFSIAPVFDKEGNCTHLVGTVHDVTERKRSEEALRASEDKFRSIFENSPAGVAMMDLDGRYLMVNSAFSAIFGYSSRELTAGGYIDLTHPEDVEQNRTIQQEVLAARGKNIRFTKRYIHKDGHTIWANVGSTLIYDPDGNPMYFITHVLDITEQRRAEQEILELNSELEQHVRDRTTQLENANRELEAFTFSVSHDLRAPLRGIDGWSLALLEEYADRIDDRGRQYLQRVRSETQHMGRLIDDLLQLSRVTQQELQKENVDLSALAVSIAARLQEEFPQRKMEFVIQPGMIAQGDPRLLEITLTNLLDNACKFSAPRTIARIEVGRAGEENQHAFFVCDNGVGFDMAYADKLFGAFQRMHKASEFPGTGVGLAIVQRIIHRHNGKIWVETAPDKGATFFFTLGGKS